MHRRRNEKSANHIRWFPEERPMGFVEYNINDFIITRNLRERLPHPVVRREPELRENREENSDVDNNIERGSILK